MRGLGVMVAVMLAALLLASGSGLAIGGYGCLKTIGTGTDEVTVLYTGGTPYELGYWHGALLRTEVQENVASTLALARAEVGQATLLATWDTMSPYVPTEFHQELQGLADGSGVPLSELHEYHAIPELSEYHCSAFNASGPATADGHMIQLRNLDWTMEFGMQDHPVIIVASPAAGYRYANITFAGMIGCPAGANDQGIGVSEKGDDFDYANETLAGIPMVFLLRDVLAHAGSLSEANAMLLAANRTSSYWYLVGDADTPDARLYACSPTVFNTWAPGEDPSGASWALPNIVYHGMSEDVFYADLATNWGSITPTVAMGIARDVAMTSSLLEAIYDLTTRDIWAAYAEGLQSAALSEFVHLNVSDPPVTFQDDFADPAWTQASWWPLGPMMAPSAGVLQAKGGNLGTVGACLDRGRSFRVDGLTFGADIKVMPGSSGGLAWGYQGWGPIHYADYHVTVDPTDQRVYLSEDVPDGPEQHYTLAAADVPGLEYGTWYRVEVVCTDTNFEVWFAARGQTLEKVIDIAQDVRTPGQQSYTGGMVALWGEPNGPSTSCLLEFDNVAATGTPDEVKRLACPLVRALREQPAALGVWLAEAQGVAGLQFDLYYDTAVLTAPSAVQKGALIASDPDWTLSWRQVAAGHLKVMAYSTTSQPLPAGAGGEVVRLAFTVNPAAAVDAVTWLDLQGVVLADRLGQAFTSAACDGGAYVARAAASIEFAAIATPQCVGLPFDLAVQAKDEFGGNADLYNGTVTLTDLTGTVAPTSVTFTNGTATVSATITAAHAADTITATDTTDSAISGTSSAFQVLAKGDPTGDGAVNVLDVLRAVNYALDLLTGTPAQEAAADPNNDGMVNVLDVIRIQNMALGLASPPPAPDRLAAVQVGGKGTPGAKTVIVPILVDDAAGLAGAQLTLAYQASAYTPVEVRAGSLLAGKDWIVSGNLSGSQARMLCFSPTATPLAAGRGTLVEVVFAQTGKGPKPRVSVQSPVCSDRQGNRLGCALSAGKALAM